MPRVTALELRRPVPQRSLPPCGGGTGRGVATRAELAVVNSREDIAPPCAEWTSLAAHSVFAVTPLPVPPPPPGRLRPSSTGYGGRERCGARLRNASIALAVAIALLGVSSTANADPIEDFYKGKTINWILSAGAGGGYSSYAHVLAPYLSAHIPGKPNIVVQNMPGAGGIRAMIY